MATLWDVGCGNAACPTKFEVAIPDVWSDEMEQTLENYVCANCGGELQQLSADGHFSIFRPLELPDGTVAHSRRELDYATKLHEEETGGKKTLAITEMSRAEWNQRGEEAEHRGWLHRQKAGVTPRDMAERDRQTKLQEAQARQEAERRNEDPDLAAEAARAAVPAFRAAPDPNTPGRAVREGRALTSTPGIGVAAGAASDRSALLKQAAASAKAAPSERAG